MDYEVYAVVATAYVLEVVYMSADIHVNLLAVFSRYWQQVALHVLLLDDVLLGLGVDGMVSYYYHPVFLGVFERCVYPCQLCLYILIVDVGLGGAVVIAVHQWGSVYEHYPYAHLAVIVAEYSGIVSSAHHPTP